jgi:hypothetical protein
VTRRALDVLAIYAAALAVRWVPLLFSSLPFNIDGFPLAAIAEDFLATGRWSLDPAEANAYNLRMPFYPTMLAALAAATGVPPLRAMAWLLPVLTGTAALGGYVLAWRTARHRGVALAAGVFLALYGPFVFLTAAAMKEALGLVLLPLVVALWLGRGDPRKRALAVFLLLALPLVHHLTTLLALGIVGLVVIGDAARAWSLGRLRWRTVAWDVLTGPALAAPAAAYYAAVGLGLLREIATADQMALFLAVSLLFGALAARLAAVGPAPPRPSSRTLGRAAWLLPLAGVVVVVANARRAVFPGTLPTTPFLLVLLVPLAVLAAPAVGGWRILRTTASGGRPAAPLALAALAVIAFALLRGLDPLSFALVYRTVDFLDFAWAGLVGVALLARPVSRRRRAVLGTVFLAALLATLPLAFAGQAVFGVENGTTEGEFAALLHADRTAVGMLGGDQRLAAIAAWYFAANASGTAPLRLARGDSLASFGLVVAEERWLGPGAQVHPLPNVVLSPAAWDDLMANHVVYAGGPTGDGVVLVVPRTG